MSSLHKHIIQLVAIAKSWALINLPGWSDESHRDLLFVHGAKVVDGRLSAKTMTVQQLGAVLDDYERRGWPRQKKVFQPKTAAKTVSPAIAHIVRLWGRLGQAGKVDNPSRPALLGWCQRQVGRAIKNLDALSVEECQAVTEALKAWLVR